MWVSMVIASGKRADGWVGKMGEAWAVRVGVSGGRGMGRGNGGMGRGGGERAQTSRG